jgi:hypothetical protein
MNGLLSRRGVQRLGVETLTDMQWKEVKEESKALSGYFRDNEKGAVLIEKRITRIPKPFREL